MAHIHDLPTEIARMSRPDYEVCREMGDLLVQAIFDAGNVEEAARARAQMEHWKSSVIIEETPSERPDAVDASPTCNDGAGLDGQTSPGNLEGGS